MSSDLCGSTLKNEITPRETPLSEISSLRLLAMGETLVS